jgi:hypothetical protein
MLKMGSDFVNVGYCECQETLGKKMIISHWPTNSIFIGLAFVGKDIVFRSIIEYSSLTDFGPYIISLVLYEDLLKDDILACVET